MHKSSTSPVHDNTISQYINNTRLHNEALDRYRDMFGGSSSSTDDSGLRPCLVDARFQHLTKVMDQEKKDAERLLESFKSAVKPC